MGHVIMRPPVRRGIVRCGSSGDTGIGRMKGVRISAREGDAWVRDAEAGGDASGAYDAVGRIEARAG